MNNIFMAMLALFLSMQVLAEPIQISIEYEDYTDANFADQMDRVRQDDALSAMVDFVNQSVPFVEPVILRMGAEDGPLFDPQINEIWVPGEFLTEIEQRFVNAALARTPDERTDVMLDVLMHTLLHEVAHAIIAQFDIPTLGKEEDAADNLANVLLLEYAIRGDEVALNAADMFALEDQDVDTLQEDDFWDEHSLDIQRYYTTICHVFGANPDDNDSLVENGELSADRADRCIDEYDQISSDWLHVLNELSEEAQ